MKPEIRMKKVAYTVTFSVMLIVSFIQTAFAPPLPIGDPSYPQANPFDSNPTAGVFDQVGTPTGAIENAYDGDMDTNINFQYGAGDGYVEVSALKKPSDNGLTDFTISFIDIKIHYRSSSTATSDDRYRIVAYVDPIATPLILQDWVTGADAAYPPGISTNAGTRTFSNVAEPNDGVWTWADLAGLRVRVETDQVDTNNLQRVYLSEVWVTAYSTGYPEPGTMSVQPPTVAGLSPSDLFYVDIYVTNVTNLWGYQFVLAFDPAILMPLEYFSYSPFVSTLPSEIGPDYVAVSYKTYDGDPVGFTGSTPVARIYFVVVSEGISLLTLRDTEAVDVYGNAVVLTPRDGWFTAGIVHDVAVTAITLNVTVVQRGDPIGITTTVVNQGTENETFLVAVCFDSTLNDTKTVTDLPSGATMILGFVWDTSTMAIGTYQVMVVTSVVPGETDTADNTLVDGTITILYRPEHDLSVRLNVPSTLSLGRSTILNATVDNLGVSDELEVELELLINDEIAGSVVIPELIRGSSYTLSQEWTPTAEGIYNVTAYVVPTPDEEYTGNNVASVNVKVRFTIAVAVLDSWDMPGYFYGKLNNEYQPLVDALNANAFSAQAVTNEEIIGGILSSFDVFVMIDNVPNEAAVPYVLAFWSSGGGVVAFDSSICFLNYAGILPPESAGSNGAYTYWDYDTSMQARIFSAHPITSGYEVGQILYGASGDAEYRVDALARTSAYSYYAMLVEDLTRPNRAYVSAYEPPSSGKVVHIWDERHWLNPNLHLMILNAMEWAKASRYEHDLAASLVVPALLRLDYPTMLNATVRNRGLNNETNVELHILINGAVVDSVLIPELLTATSYTLSYLWTPTIEGNYNITAYAEPVPNEAYIQDNQATRFVNVMRPLIQPVEGQWANYTITSPYMQIQLNATYSHYLSPTQMYVDLWLKDPYGNTMTYWLTLNVLNRMVEAGLWQGAWYPLWIENDVTIGSEVGILTTYGTVTTSRFIEVGDFVVDCWGAQLPYYDGSYTFWFDKVHGLVVAVDYIVYYYNYTETWRLIATNVPLNYLPRIQIQTDPQSGPVGTEVTITGTSATPNGSVEIYWDNTPVGTGTVDENGNFVFTFAVPSSIMGSHNITVLDLTTNMTDTVAFTVLPSICIAPSNGPIGTRVVITGSGFGANETVVLCFDDMQIGTVFTDSLGSFTATFNVPLSQSGLHLVKAWYGRDYALATFTVTDVSPLDVNMEVGAVYFKGEIAECYVQIVFKGRPVDATSMTSTLYMPDGTTQTLTYERIATGLYKIRYTISGKGSMIGTYTLVVEASLIDSNVNAYGTSITTFIVKPTWERETTRMAALSVASIGLVSAMVLLWRKEKKRVL